MLKLLAALVVAVAVWPALAAEAESFNKYLVDRDGKVFARFESSVDPMSTTMRRAVESIL
jgi:glutathione peroxidase-family protein